MTAKRFTMIYFETDGNLIFDESKHDGEWYNSAECLQDNEIVELLNEQHETIQRLKQNIDELLSVNVEEELLKENEQLKQQLKDCEKFRYNVFNKLNEMMTDE